MPTVAQVEEQIYACEGFRVRLTPLKPTVKTMPSYDFLVMAPQRWRISDWKTMRLSAYVPFVREIVILRGDDAPAKTDVALGRLRDTYYEAKYGSIASDAAKPTAASGSAISTTVTPLPRPSKGPLAAGQTLARRPLR